VSANCLIVEIHKLINLGYGATTFPALTEAITIEKNATLARHESDRLEKLIKKLTAHVAS